MYGHAQHFGIWSLCRGAFPAFKPPTRREDAGGRRCSQLTPNLTDRPRAGVRMTGSDDAAFPIAGRDGHLTLHMGDGYAADLGAVSPE